MTATVKIAKKLIFFSFLSAVSIVLISCAPLREHRTIDMDHLNPSAADLQELKSIKRIRFISEEYVEPGHPKATFNLESNLQSIFKAFPELELVSHDAAQYDATLTIKINGHFIGEKYVKSGRSSSGSFHTYGKPFILYVGSRIDGTISLDSNRSAVYNWSFDNKFNLGPLKKSIEPSRFRWSVELEPVYSRIYGMLGDICGGEALALALKDKVTWGVYFWAVKKSFKYLTDGEAAVAPLISIIQDKTLRSAIRSGAMEALGDIDGNTAFEFLISAVKEERSLDAAKALGNRGNVRAVEPLIDLLKHCGKQNYCETVTAGALRLITGYPPDNKIFFPESGLHVSDAASWEQWWGKNKINYVKK